MTGIGEHQTNAGMTLDGKLFGLGTYRNLKT
jgi:hypothetical protein